MRGTWKELVDGRWEGIDSLSVHSFLFASAFLLTRRQTFTCMFYDFEGVASQ
ncbi:hypothetical protein ARMSODRAFT_966392 [Armillaria solidipes]|uniref:Uncharacterized protein n=1 Tax=Armillaria solidipes TaxID=1076256 RepID=A0A2H3ATQ6_9AGAR|nr:hypothetical protein ARMSODRAFT_966392 [Armillaria solidipes]